ncbi:TonB-dependent receptor [Algivirga pacifica]|uniref:TonB-dependent receptor n=2 Tax=Algivirga pacifica TaxID=1162670 RepID=A0ABP9D1I6_9BACT
MWAQDKVVSGTVTDENGDPLPGVSVLLKGTSKGVATDFDGNYTLPLETGQETLVVSYVGYQTQEVTVGNQSTMNIQLVPDSEQMEEVVVIGYGTAKKEDVTGSVQAVTAADFNQGAINSPQELLNGKLPGVQITTGGGAPGAGATIRIRGGSSLNANNDPLIVIDGVPLDNDGVSGMRNPLNTINPNDIETFTVLKDASSTAIYGSRASNGVILITTKKGSRDRVSVDYNGNVSIYTPIKTVDVLDATQYRALFTEQFPDNVNLLGDADTDWQDEIFETAVGTEHNVSVSGTIADGGLPYRASVGYNNTDGILKTENMERITVGLNLNPTFFDEHLKVNASAKYMYVDNRFASTGAIGNAISMDPTQPVRTANGEFYYWPTELVLDDGETVISPNPIAPGNPVSTLERRRDQSQVDRFIGNLQVDYRLHFAPDFRVNLNLGGDFSDAEGDIVVAPNAVHDQGAFINDGFFSNYSQNKSNELLETYLAYERDFGESRLNALLGYSWQHFRRDSKNNQMFGNGTGVLNTIDKTENYLVSFYGRFNYSLYDKYVMTFTLRNDGSSRFSEDNRWGWFPALALAWNMEKEDWFGDADWLTQLKLRAGYGITGQQDIPGNDYPYIGTYQASLGTAQYVYYGPAGPIYTTTFRANKFNEDLKWEETTTFNVGIDYGFFDDRITGLIDWYYRRTDDLLSQVPVSAGSNLGNELITNVGTMVNQGIEFAIDVSILRSQDWRWSVGYNITYNKNEITKLSGGGDDFVGVPTGGISSGTGNLIQIHTVGHPARSFYVYEQVYDQDGRPIEGLYVDRNEDGVINEFDKYHYKDPAPNMLMGLNSNLGYRNWDFSVAARINLNNYVYNDINAGRSFYQRLQTSGAFANNVTEEIFDTQFNNPQYFSDHYVENAGFFRLDNVTLGYNFNRLFDTRLNARLYGTINNMFVITNYDGIDPEIFSGIDNNFYPRPRTYTMGVNVSF